MKYRLSKRDHSVVQVIEQNPGITTAQLGEKLNLTRNNVAAITSYLIRHKAVNRTYHYDGAAYRFAYYGKDHPLPEGASWDNRLRAQLGRSKGLARAKGNGSALHEANGPWTIRTKPVVIVPEADFKTHVAKGGFMVTLEYGDNKAVSLNADEFVDLCANIAKLRAKLTGAL